MDDKLAEIVDGIRKLERQLILKLQKGEEEFFYTVHKGLVKFEREVKLRNRLIAKRIRHYLRDAAILNTLNGPAI
tara:strand:- start:88 stop:312 length:225 start_codon:yes stop_codon:yes gene_type:complete